ncbi:MAG: hypothetical protein FJZ66_09990 [Bacteroidetes bacterium]|nr:hypothetical protein [Bacteroidota bacterium]
MKNVFYLLTFLVVITSCKSDEEKINEANILVEKFANEVALQNFSAANKLYPKFKILDRFWSLNNFQINNTTVETDGSICVYGTFSKYTIKNREGIKFILKDNGDGQKIIDSKGLSSYYNSPLFEYCKLKGFLSDNLEDCNIDSDISIAKVCKEHLLDLQILLIKCGRYVNENVVMNKQLTTIQAGYFGDSYSGTISITNNTGFDLNNDSFDFNIYWFKNGVQTEAHKIEFLNEINAYKTVNHQIHYGSLASRAKTFRFGATVKNQDSFANEVVRKLDYAESL